MAPVTHVTVRKLPRLKVRVAVALPAETMVAPPPEPSMPAVAPPPTPVEVAASVTPLARPAAEQVVLALNPSGEGNPDAVTCRVPQQLPGSRFPGPQVCKANRIWATLRARREEISPDGRMVVYLDDFQRNKALAGNCQATFFSRSGVTILPGPSTTFCF
jgi:hypothetical protein